MITKRMLFIFAAGAIATGCGNGTTDADASDVANTNDTGSITDATADAGADTGPADTGSNDDAPSIPVIHNCTAASYVDQTAGTDNDRMIMTQGPSAFDYPCMTINAGQSVMFMWNFTTHPLAPGLAPSHMSDPPGTEPSPIQMHTSGSIYSVMFPNPGFYPFYCTVHQASGMIGVIQVL